MQQQDFTDSPISMPSEDAYGIDPFAAALARSIAGMGGPEGTVIAVHGAWGSGKSSAVNLIVHHLSDAIKAGEISPVRFNPWWFRGEEALVIAFFRELYSATEPNLSAKARAALPKLGARLLKAGSMVGAASDLAGAAGAGKVASTAMDWLGKIIEGGGESVEKLHSQLAEGLQNQSTRYLVIIDDIDRLAPDEALAMFKMVKSAGRLPNVIYLLAYDRTLAEQAVAERFPSQGPHYLEKIVQASFELPAPTAQDMHRQALTHIERITGPADEKRVVHVMNLFYEAVAPELRTPRDVFRFISALSVTWPAAEENVDLGDFLALEALRLFRPHTYRAIRSAPDVVCYGGGRPMSGRSDGGGEKLDALLLAAEPEADKQRLRDALMRLFPPLEQIWSNMTYQGDYGWSRDRRACMKEHFPAYFQCAPGPDAVAKSEMDELISRIGDADFVRETMIAALRVRRRSGGTKAALLLDSLTQHAETLPLESAPELLRALFSIADEIDVEEDKATGFSLGNNMLRLHWLIRPLLHKRTTLDERSSMLMMAAEDASLGWLADLSDSMWRDYHPRKENEAPETLDKCLVTEEAAGRLRDLLLKRIQDVVADGTIFFQHDLARLLYVWRDRVGSEVVRPFVTSALEDSQVVAKLAAEFTGVTWSQGMGMFSLGDHVAKRSYRANVQHLSELMDEALFRSRLEALASNPDGLDEDATVAIRRLRLAWIAADAGED
jgi:predicted KAP-like P-loop ATPase